METVEAVLIGIGLVIGIPFVVGFLQRSFGAIFNTKVSQEVLETQEGERQDKQPRV